MPNKVYLDDSHPLKIVTGHNKSDKSTLLRAGGQIVLLVNTGARVPATSVYMPVRRRICCVYDGHDDVSRATERQTSRPNGTLTSRARRMTA